MEAPSWMQEVLEKKQRKSKGNQKYFLLSVYCLVGLFVLSTANCVIESDCN